MANSQEGPRSPAGSCLTQPMTPIAKIPERELFERWQQRHDVTAREELVRRHMPLARTLALRYQRSGQPLEDLVQVANLALLKAIDRFDIDRGPRFASFAVPNILGELRRYFRDSTWTIHVSRGVQENALKVDLARRELTHCHGRSPTVQELSRYLTIGQEAVIEALQAQAAYAPSSLDAPLVDEDTETILDTLGVHDPGFARLEKSSTVASAMDQLPRREQRILFLRFFEDRTQSEIAREIGTSQMQISRVIRSTLEQLRVLVE